MGRASRAQFEAHHTNQQATRHAHREVASTCNERATKALRARAVHADQHVTVSADAQISVAEVAAAFKEVRGQELPTKCLGSMEDLTAEIDRRLQADPAAWPMYIPLMYQVYLCTENTHSRSSSSCLCITHTL